MRSSDRFEYTTAQDPFFDFCLWEYSPPNTPSENKYRSANLLFQSFEVAGINERIFDLIAAIREGFGPLNTVYGVKRIGANLAWEFYFYDYRRTQRERSIHKLLDIIRPIARCRIQANENLRYFMFSVDVTDGLVSGARDLDEIHMYIGNPGSAVSSGICYSLTKGATRLENFYFFFDTRSESDEILNKIACSAHIDSTAVNIDQILLPELRNCKVTVVANKQVNDSVYFSRVNIDQLILFLRKMEYPGEIVAFVEENRSRLDHLLYDVGFDYRMDGKDLVILKSGYYGVF